VIRKAALLLAAVTSIGCVTTREEGETLKRDMAVLKTQVAEVQRQQSDEKNNEGARLEAISKRVADLEGTLAALRQADADSGVQLDKVVAEVQALRGEVEEAKHGLQETSASVASILAHPPTAVAVGGATPEKVDDPKKPVTIAGQEVPADAKAHYEFAKKLYDEKKFAEASEAFDLFLKRHEKDAPEYKSNAAYWKADSTFQLADSLTDADAKKKALKQAILAYQSVLEDPKTQKGDVALYKVGLAFEQLEFKDEAATFYDELVKKYPKSSLVADAKKHLKTVQAGAKKKGK